VIPAASAKPKRGAKKADSYQLQAVSYFSERLAVELSQARLFDFCRTDFQSVRLASDGLEIRPTEIGSPAPAPPFFP
jgi:hypothetical protein